MRLPSFAGTGLLCAIALSGVGCRSVSSSLGLERKLAEARADYESDPTKEEAIIWYGRRLSYLGRYEDAVAVYSRGLELHPASYKLFRHRGHRFISLRRFEDAARDLGEAANLVEGVPDEIEPDGAPNAFNVPRSTNHSNVFYHLGLAHYLRGEFEAALSAYRRCMEFSRVNDDMTCATANWLYLTLRRTGRDAEAARVLAPIREDMEILENHAYHELLLLYGGERTPAEVLGDREPGSLEFATRGFGVAMWNLLEGRPEECRRVLEAVCSGEPSAAFGTIAAEAELARTARDSRD